MRLPYSLRPPRKPGYAWGFRCSHKGIRIEITTGHCIEAVAWAWAADLHGMIERDTIMNLDDPRPPGLAEVMPEAIPLGAFEHFLMTSFILIDETIVRLGTNRAISFHLNAGGYRQAEIPWESRRKRVLEHRWKFLLHHRWLPRSVDHKNRVRHDNRLGNLKASTAYLQAGNRGKPHSLPQTSDKRP